MNNSSDNSDVTYMWWIYVETSVRFVWGAVNLNSTLRRILNGDNLTLIIFNLRLLNILVC
jgi:hypothetical protein